jgi:hypothetical protein
VKGDSSQIDNVISAEVTAEFRFVDRSVRARYLGEFLHAYPQLFAQKNPHPAKHLSSFHRQAAPINPFMPYVVLHYGRVFNGLVSNATPA